MKTYKTLKAIIEQLEMPNYQTKDGLHVLTDNVAFRQLKELAQIDVIEDLKNMVNNYQVLNGCYVISKNVIDVYIEYLESKQL